MADKNDDKNPPMVLEQQQTNIDTKTVTVEPIAELAALDLICLRSIDATHPVPVPVRTLRPPSSSNIWSDYLPGSTICVLEPFDHHYGNRSSDDLDAHDFTVIHKPAEMVSSAEEEQRRCRNNRYSFDFDESTEVLLVNSECRNLESGGRRGGKPNGQAAVTTTANTSGTDSDVEVLMSEDSDWSAPGVSREDLRRRQVPATAEKEEEDDDEDQMPELTASVVSPSSAMGDMTLPQQLQQQQQRHRRQESSDQDNSVSASASIEEDLEHLSRPELVNVIRENNRRICHLETTLQHYRVAQLQLFAHIDAIRAEFGEEFGCAKK